MENTRFQTALYILLSLAHHKEEASTSTSLAKSLKTNPVFVRRLLSQLSEAGLVTTSKGRQGGVKLSLPPEKINLFTIYEAVALPKVIAPVKKSPNSHCAISCAMKGVVGRLSDVVENSVESALVKIHLSHLLKQIDA